MPFIWNDKTYWERYKKSFIIFKVLIPLFIVVFFIIYMFFSEKMSLTNILLLSSTLSIVLVSLINIFKQYPNAGVPDTYSVEGKTFIYIFQFIATLIGFFFIVSYVF